MKIKFKFLRVYYLIGSVVGTICALLLVFQPDFGLYSKALLSSSFVIVILIGASGAILSVCEKMKAEDLEKFYSANRNVNYCLRDWDDVQKQMAPSEKTFIESSPAILKKEE